ncbi:MAG: SatD family protein [Pseudomonadota bacterium]
MADVVGSGGRPAAALQRELADVVGAANERHRAQILSPLTITLGDEWQGIIASLEAVVTLICFFELDRLDNQRAFRLRYAHAFDTIETSINTEIAHGMLGPALTNARRALTSKARSRPRFTFATGSDSFDRELSDVFAVIDDLDQRWSPDDVALITMLLSEKSDAQIAEALGHNRTSVWRRRQSLLIDAYRRLWRVAQARATAFDQQTAS